MTLIEQEVRLRALIRDSWNVHRAKTSPMPTHHAIHVAHVTGFAGGLIAAGVPQYIAEAVAAAEIARYGEDGP